jgi:type I restriction enzyme, S subunit
LTAKDSSEFSTAWSFITQHFGELYSVKENVVELRKTILQLAVMGKLVRQDPNDEPASELLRSIDLEKQRLVKEGKIKKSKPLPEIKPEEVPYDLPKSWIWCYVWDIAQVITSGSREWAKHYSDSGAIFVTMGNLSRGNYNLRMENIRYVTPPMDSEGARTKLEEHDLLISITGDVGNLGLIPNNFGDAYINQHTCLLRFMPTCQNRYFPELMRTPLAKSQFIAPQRGIKNSFRLGDVGEMIIPLPPLAEQGRIVEKIDRLMGMCDRLEGSIESAKGKQTDLLNALMSQV